MWNWRSQKTEGRPEWVAIQKLEAWSSNGLTSPEVTREHVVT